MSVVVPAYNHARYIRDAVDSVLGQSWGDLELVITDDGSTDGTADVVTSLGDSRVKLRVFPRNRGACDALNDAIRRSVGKYVAILNSDDFFLPNKLADQVEFLDGHPEVGATFGMARLVDDRGADLGDEAHPYRKVFVGGNRSRHSWLRYFFFSGNALCHPTAMVRRACYDRVGLYDRGLMQLPDLDMWVRLCSAYEINVSPAELTAFRIRSDGGNVSGQQSGAQVRLVWEQKQVLDRFLQLSRSEQVAAFAGDVPGAGELAEADWPAALARLALSIDSVAHQAFALAALQEDVGRLDGVVEPLELFSLTGSNDIYDVLGRQELGHLRIEHEVVLRSVYWRGTASLRRAVSLVRRLKSAWSRF